MVASEEGNNLAYIEKHRGKWSEKTQSYLTSISDIDELLEWVVSTWSSQLLEPCASLTYVKASEGRSNVSR